MIMNCRICRNMSEDKATADGDVSENEWQDDKESEF
jgi:hypothetical protein